MRPLDETYVIGSVKEGTNSVTVEVITPSGEVRKIRMTLKLWEGFAYKSADVIDRTVFEKMSSVGEACEALTRALRLIADAPYSYKALAMKLKRSGFSPESADAAIATVKRRGLIDEDAQALDAAEKYAKRNLRGPSRIKADLIAHGYPADVAARAVEGVPAELYDEALEKNIAKKGIPEDKKDRDKLAASLIRLGFPVSKIIEKMKKHPYASGSKGQF